MAPIVSTIEIARTPDAVFGYVTDPEHFREWQHDVVDAHVESAGAQRAGSRLTQTRKIGPGRRTFTQEVTDNSPPSHWAAKGVDGPIRPGMDLRVEPLEGGARSRVTFALDFDPHGIGRVLVPLFVRPLASRTAPQSYQHLKERLEST